MSADDAGFEPCLQQVERARTLHVSGISQAISASARDTVFAAIARARSSGVRVSYDLNFRPRLWSVEAARPVVERTVAGCDIFSAERRRGRAAGRHAHAGQALHGPTVLVHRRCC